MSKTKGYRAREIGEWDRTRHIMFAVLKAAGAKKIRTPSDVLKLPSDIMPDGTTRNDLQERLRQKHLEYFGRQQT